MYLWVCVSVSWLAGGSFTFRANAAENNIVAGKIKSVRVFDVLLQAGNILHVHIENPAAPLAPHMAVVVQEMVKAISTSGYLHFAYLAPIGKQIEIAIYGGAADVGVRFDDLMVYLVSGGMAMQFVYNFQNQGTLDRVTVHIWNPCRFSVLIDILYYLVLYINNDCLSILFLNFSEKIARNEAAVPYGGTFI